MSTADAELQALFALPPEHPFTDPAFGELRFTPDPPAVAASFLAGPRADAARVVFDSVRWFAVRADGGASGIWQPPTGPAVVLTVDSEGGLRVTGTTPLDHLAREGDRAVVSRFCTDSGLPVPPPATPIDAPDPGALLSAESLAVTAPRPLARVLATCALADGRVLVVTGEDFSGTSGAAVTHGAVYLFEPTTDRFRPLPPLVLDGHDPAHALALDDGTVLLLARDVEESVRAWRFDPSTEGWTEAGGPTGRYALGTTAFSTGLGVVLTGGGNEMVAVWTPDGWTDAPDLEEARQRDRAVPLGDGRWLFVNGFEVPEPFWEEETDTTLWLDARGHATEGPALPTDENGGGPAYLRSDGVVVAWGDAGLTMLRAGAWSALREAGDVHPLAAETQVGDMVWALRAADRALVRVDLHTCTAEPVATSPLPHRDAAAHALPDGRVLFVGGTLFGNVDCEPQLWNPTTGRFSALPGLEAAHAAQVATLATQSVD